MSKNITYAPFCGADQQYIIIFRGGSGGNFLAHLITNFIIQKDDQPATVISDTNEYIFGISKKIRAIRKELGRSESELPSVIIEQHLNMPFTTVEGDTVYTVHRYKELLNYYKDNKLKVMVIHDPKSVLFTSMLVNHKHHERGLLGEEHLPHCWSNHQKKTHINKYKKIPKNYKFFSHMLTRYDIPNLSLNYQSLIVNQNVQLIKQIIEFCGITATNDLVDNIASEISKYHEQNVQFMSKYNIALDGKWLE
tara:strand:- start:344 stop:1096 length:753 start_codon:yes stop_codon:yes gene_type:complete